MALQDFFKGLTALDLTRVGAELYTAKQTRKIETVKANTKAAEDKQRARVEQAELKRQQQLVAGEVARKTLNNEQLWKVANTMVMTGALTLVGAVVLKIIKAR